MYELMCTFFFNCHTHTLASDTKLGQPNWMNYWGQFSQKNLWLRVGINGEFVEMNGGAVEEMSVTLSNAWDLFLWGCHLIRLKL